MIFKSTKENYRKESLGLKRNTVREFDDSEDQRKRICDEFIEGKITDINIKILNRDDIGGESFTEDIKDITKWGKLYILSW